MAQRNVPQDRACRVDRRGFGVAGVAALIGLSGTARAAALRAQAADAAQMMALVDGRVGDAAGFAALMRRDWIETLRFDGDVTDVWQARLRPYWDGQNRWLMGVSRPDALFCLDILARDAGYRLVHDVPYRADMAIPAPLPTGLVHPAHLPGADHAPRFWIITHRSLLA
ncbi:hypothetical protein GTZ99_14395 [Novosphingobium sp. FSY-8]|uniref:Uncharacterized protein n=1 Tax=Novosphingobium ovatum TaxID=1908523 RepID=A0ABW9XH61_9SPHN|nr:hypothetical protein [Novosphingobium ovatum]NBC37742.1 hypothetical protein [Novosphingobium ovatum]